MKILLVTLGILRDDTNGGNTLVNIFRNFPVDTEFAQICCTGGKPHNTLIKHYYQITDEMIVKNVFRGTQIVNCYNKELLDVSVATGESSRLTTGIDFFKGRSAHSIRLVREFLWKRADWKTEELKKFITDFSPDVVFSPCSTEIYMFHVTQFAADLARCPVIGYISDDIYSLRQFELSPVWWITRLWRRCVMRKYVPSYSLLYTMTDIQLQYCQKHFSCPVKILCKSGNFSTQKQNKTFSTPYRIIYAGRIDWGRWRTLVMLSKELKKVNKQNTSPYFVFDIFTSSRTPLLIKWALIRLDFVAVHPAVPQSELLNEYHKSDIALHAEGLSLHHRLKVRMSFSTKIIDCLESGCAVLAVADKKQGGFAYLREQDAVLCADSRQTLRSTLNAIAQDGDDLLRRYALKARECGFKNHQQDEVSAKVILDFADIVCNSKNKNESITD